MLDNIRLPDPWYLVLIIAIIVFTDYQSQKHKKIKDAIARNLEAERVEAVYLDTGTTQETTGILFFRFGWGRAEIIVAAGSILALFYTSVLGYRLYRRILHWHMNKRAWIPNEIRDSALVKSIRLIDGDLEIVSQDRAFTRRVTIRGVRKSGTFDRINKVLTLPN